MRRFLTGWTGRADEGPPDPSLVSLVDTVLPMIGSPERWAVYTVPGPRDLPGPDAPRGRRERWWRDHISAAGGALLLIDPEVDPVAVRTAVDVLVQCAISLDQGADSVSIAGRFRALGPVGGVRSAYPVAAMDVVRSVAAAFSPVGCSRPEE